MNPIRLFLSISYLFSLSVFFFSCKDDAIVNTNPSAYYNWTPISIPYDTVHDAMALDNGNVIIYADGIQKISSSGITPVTVNDTSFNFQTFFPFTSDYYVFGGTKRNDSQTGMIKIYDNGIYRNYELPRQNTTAVANAAYFISKDKFFVTIFPESKKYFLFNNGTFTEFELSEGKAVEFFKAAGNLYLKAYSTTVSGYSYYRMTETNSQYLWGETFSSYYATDRYYLNNDLIRITHDSTREKFSFFTEQGWQDYFTYNTFDIHEYITDVVGESRNQFAAFKINLGTGAAYAYAWDGANFTGQTNFPTGIAQYPYGGYFAMSNYRDNTFYFYPNYGSRKLYKVTFTGY